MNIQIRLRDPSYEHAYHHFQDYIEKAEKALVFNHKPTPDNNHYHIYLFGISIKPDSIRKYFMRAGYPKEHYSVSTTAGGKKEKTITPQIAYQYGTTKHMTDPILNKNFDTFTLDLYKASAQVYYGQKPASELKNGDTIIVTKEINHIRPDKVWEKLKDQLDTYKDKTIKQIKAMICAQWLNEGKAIPRPSDLHRYAVSLHTLAYYNGELIPEEALEHMYE